MKRRPALPLPVVRLVLARVLAAAALFSAFVAAPLVLANALHVPMRGENEEMGVGLLLVAAGLSIASGVLRGWRTRAGLVALALGLAVPLALGGALVYVIAHAPTHPYTVRGWTRLPDGTPGTTVPPGAFPSAVRAAFAGAAVGGTGCATFASEGAWRAFDSAYHDAGGNATGDNDPRVVTIEGHVYRFGFDVPCAEP